MLENFIYSVNAVLPYFVLVLLGAVLKKTCKISDAFTERADWLVFNIGLPSMLFLEIASCSLSRDFDPSLILFLVIAVTLSFLLVSIAVSLTVRDITKRGAMIQGMCRSNFAVLGVPLAINMFGESGGAAVAIAMPFVVPMFNAYSVIILSVFSGGEKKKLSKATILGIIRNVVTNPLIIGVVAALPFMIFSLPLPTVADKSLSYLSGLTTPLALMSLGANFKLESLRGSIKYAIASALGKTVILPTIALTVAVLCGLRNESLGVVLICFGAPAAGSSYLMSKKMDNDHNLASQILLLSNFICVITIVLLIFTLKTLNLI